MPKEQKRWCNQCNASCGETPNLKRVIDGSLFALACLLAFSCHAAVQSREPVVLSYISPHDMATTIANLKRAISNNNFRFIREQTVDDGFTDSPNGKQVILYFCNFDLLHDAFQREKHIGFMLPCRVTVTEVDGRVTIWARNPKYTGALTDRATLRELCDKVKSAYIAVIEEATL